MVSRTTSPKLLGQARGARGGRVAFTLPEMLIAIGVSSIVLVALSSVYLYANRSFVVLANHLDMHSDSRMAMDQLSREIRESSRLISHTTNQLTFLRHGQQVTISYEPNTGLLKKVDANGSKTILRDCQVFQHEIFQRTPSNSTFGFFPAATGADCKVVRLTWLCSRDIGGSAENQSTLRSSQVVMRNK